jgi:membrane protein implicated in regulation of membrane protease activity
MHPLDIFYVVSLLLGGGYTVVSMLMGGLSHAAHSISHVAHTGHVPHLDIGGHGHHAGHIGHADGAGHHDMAHHGAHHDGDSGGDSGDGDDASGRPNLLAYFNPTLLSGFLLGCGAAGLMSRYLGVLPAASLPYAGIGGLALWGSAFLIVSQMFGKAQGTSHNRRSDVVGLRGNVTAPIEGQRPGMVAFNVGGTRQQLRAVTEDEEPIPMGAEVRIRRVDEHTALVMRID